MIDEQFSRWWSANRVRRPGPRGLSEEVFPGELDDLGRILDPLDRPRPRTLAFCTGDEECEATTATRTTSKIEDRTSHTSTSLRKKTRLKSKVYALVLHQMAFSRGNTPKKYDTVVSHFAILPDGALIQLHPVTAYLNASSTFNAGSVAVEFAGNFPSTKGKYYKPDDYGKHQLTQAQIESGRYLVEYLIREINLTHILAHRQSSNSRDNDPGPDVWYHVGQWAVDKHGLKDGGDGYKVGGKAIPKEWRTWGEKKDEKKDEKAEKKKPAGK